MVFRNPDDSITVPTDATTGSRIVIGTELPEALSSDLVHQWTAAIVSWFNDTDFEFTAVGTSGASSWYGRGTYDTTNGRLFKELIRLNDVPNYMHGGNADHIRFLHKNVTLNVANVGTSVQSSDSFFTVGNGSNEKILTADGRNSSINGAFSVGNTSSTVYADAPGTPAVTIQKEYDDTGLRFEVHATAFNLVALSQVRWGIKIVGSLGFTNTYDVCQMPFNQLSFQLQASGCRHVQGGLIPADSYTCYLQWRNVAGVGTINTIANDWRSINVRETGN